MFWDKLKTMSLEVSRLVDNDADDMLEYRDFNKSIKMFGFFFLFVFEINYILINYIK